MEVVGLRPALAGAVLLIGRAVDAFSDPAIGRISDRTRARWGRRKPYLALGALPFGATFALLWITCPLDSTLATFVLYAALYSLHTLAATVVSVPYVALLPEMALDYQERTSINTYRAVAAVLGTLLAAVSVGPLAEAFGGGAAGYAWTGALLGVWLVLPWVAVYATAWERPEFRRESRLGWAAGLRVLAGNRAYRRLAALYVCARAAVDIVGANFLIYFHYWLGRREDFEPTLLILFSGVALSLPLWLRLSRRVDKHRAFARGAVAWILVQSALLLVMPDWPRWLVFLLAGLAGVGYAAVDLMPWAMLGDVIDADELETGERREGLYAGTFTFLRKLGGAGGVALAGVALDLAGFQAGGAQPESALLAIRGVVGAAPTLFLALAAAIATGYPLTRAAHASIVARLAATRAARG
jgi:GPH family glycoside/pentoside/hexuronide:cation symporter